MPKFICSECKKILIRNANSMRFHKFQSFCASMGRQALLTRLRIRKNKND